MEDTPKQSMAVAALAFLVSIANKYLHESFFFVFLVFRFIKRGQLTPVKVQQNCFTVQQIDSGETIHMLSAASISNMFLFGTLAKNNIWSPISQHDAFKNLKLIVDVLKQTAVSL